MGKQPRNTTGIDAQIQSRLEHLDKARRALLAISPNAAAFLGREFNELAAQKGVQLSEATRRTQCLRCGTVLVSGVTLRAARLITANTAGVASSSPGHHLGKPSDPVMMLHLSRDLELLRAANRSDRQFSELSLRERRRVRSRSLKNVRNKIQYECGLCHAKTAMSGSTSTHAKGVGVRAQQLTRQAGDSQKENLGTQAVPASTKPATPVGMTRAGGGNPLFKKGGPASPRPENNTRNRENLPKSASNVLATPVAKAKLKRLQSPHQSPATRSPAPVSATPPPSLSLLSSSSALSSSAKRRKKKQMSLKALVSADASKQAKSSPNSAGPLSLDDFLSSL
ncbi:hypothetical protein EV182_000021 [Spiromyces aspiralis]|uniref:Uncharacterized protein n=1 Tax=Spiromyces aspiralis TaxID=68401 RepID=A0ACC1HLI7_9FUNG|nr:hypothetical protein EV182_000021 [Spiromyces aspiralis]